MLKEMKSHICETLIYNTLVDNILKWCPITSVNYVLINILRKERVMMEVQLFEYVCVPL